MRKTPGQTERMAREVVDMHNQGRTTDATNQLGLFEVTTHSLFELLDQLEHDAYLSATANEGASK